MPTYTALTTLLGRDSAEALGLALEGLDPSPTGIGVFEVEDGSGFWEVGAYFLDPPDRAALMLLSAMHGAGDFAVSKLDDQDWVAQVRRELTPVAAGRFIVYGAHDADRIGVQKIGLKIEAAMAFGTGHHGTTQGCLLLLDRLAKQGLTAARVADIGCGTGVLAMAAARCFRSRGIATDIDPIAMATARENLLANKVGGQVAVLRVDGTRSPRYREEAPFDLVFANILAGPLKRLAPEIRAILAPGGRAILSGLLTRQIPGVAAVYRGHGLVVEDRITLGDWTSLVLRRYATRAM
ncbi:MAG: 50S ribosomal protein L11 methyltransferase [Pseudomonadota bacterium]